MSASTHRIPKIFVTLTALGLVSFVVIQSWSAIRERPAERARQLMGATGAEAVSLALNELDPYPLEHLQQAGTEPIVRRVSDFYRPGDVLFVNFWATYCEPCVEELPSMLALNQRLAGSGRFRMLAISYDDSWAPIESFFRRVMGRMPNELAIARDPADSNEAMLRTRLGTRLIPDSYVIKDGRIIARFVNKRDWMDPKMVEYFVRLLEMP